MKKKPTVETLEDIRKELEKLDSIIGRQLFNSLCLESGELTNSRTKSRWKISPHYKERYENYKKAEKIASIRFKSFDPEIKLLELVKQAIQKEYYKSVDLKKTKVPAGVYVPIETLEDVLLIIKYAEDTYIDLKELILDREMYHQAIWAFKTSKEPRTDKRQAAFFRSLGITAIGITGKGKRPVKINNQALFWEYFNLLYTGSDPWAALEVIKEKNDLPSTDEALKQIRLYETEVKRALKAEGLNSEVFKNFIPGNPSKQKKQKP